MEFLNRAERYTEARGDLARFKLHYNSFRQYNSVVESVRRTLSFLYDDHVVDLLEFQ